MSLHELMGWEGPMTHRQFLVWCRWEEDEYGRPDRSDYYQMQTAAAVYNVRGMFSKSAKAVGVSDMVIPFRRGPQKRRRQDPEEIRAILKAYGMGGSKRPRQ